MGEKEATVAIVYKFIFRDKVTESFTVQLDPETFEFQPQERDLLPDWSKLGFHQCDHCPLAESKTPACPVARNLSSVVTTFKNYLSTDQVRVEVQTRERSYSKEVSLQSGLFSLFGLVMATSGCPHLGFLRPIARHHLPFASVDESVSRVVSSYLLGEFFVGREGGNPDWELKKLAAMFDAVTLVNQGIIKRIRGLAAGGDANVNSVFILESLAQLLQVELETNMSRLTRISHTRPSLPILES